ncbi:MAG: hypothetical protein IIA82_08780 [Thaumarchaeota archaeon]|nr:hypothetical protein [Nitrososphaerota archaeon]
MGFLDDIAKTFNSLANLQKSQTEKIKAQTKKDKMKRITKENKELKKALSRNKIIGIVGIVVTITSVFIGYSLLVYFPINNVP